MSSFEIQTMFGFLRGGEGAGAAAAWPAPTG